MSSLKFKRPFRYLPGILPIGAHFQAHGWAREDKPATNLGFLLSAFPPKEKAEGAADGAADSAEVTPDPFKDFLSYAVGIGESIDESNADSEENWKKMINRRKKLRKQLSEIEKLQQQFLEFSSTLDPLQFTKIEQKQSIIDEIEDLERGLAMQKQRRLKDKAMEAKATAAARRVYKDRRLKASLLLPEEIDDYCFRKKLSDQINDEIKASLCRRLIKNVEEERLFTESPRLFAWNVYVQHIEKKMHKQQDATPPNPEDGTILPIGAVADMRASKARCLMEALSILEHDEVEVEPEVGREVGPEVASDVEFVE